MSLGLVLHLGISAFFPTPGRKIPTAACPLFACNLFDLWFVTMPSNPSDAARLFALRANYVPAVSAGEHLLDAARSFFFFLSSYSSDHLRVLGDENHQRVLYVFGRGLVLPIGEDLSRTVSRSHLNIAARVARRSGSWRSTKPRWIRVDSSLFCTMEHYPP